MFATKGLMLALNVSASFAKDKDRLTRDLSCCKSLLLILKRACIAQRRKAIGFYNIQATNKTEYA